MRTAAHEPDFLAKVTVADGSVPWYWTSTCCAKLHHLCITGRLLSRLGQSNGSNVMLIRFSSTGAKYYSWKRNIHFDLHPTIQGRELFDRVFQDLSALKIHGSHIDREGRY